jgi:hypothetical protein
MIKRPEGRQVFFWCGVVCVDGRCDIRCPVALVAADGDFDLHICDVHFPLSFKLRGHCEIRLISEAVSLFDDGKFYVGVGMRSIGPFAISELTIDGLRLAVHDSKWEVISYGLWDCEERTVLIP